MNGRLNPPDRSEVTPERLYWSRRKFIRNATLFLCTATGVGGALVALSGGKRGEPAPEPGAGPVSTGPDLVYKPGAYGKDETMTSFRDVTTYNNFYEYGTGKGDPAEHAHTLRPRPWSVSIEGEVERPEVVDVETLLKRFPLEERIYRMRCVEAWSMVIPWIGFPLAALLEQVRPTSKAAYVACTTLHDTARMPGQKRSVLNWPYVEGLRLDEAFHPLTLLAVGLYGKVLPNQNGAPMRLVVPWKYGFKGIKSIVKIRLMTDEPRTTWNEAGPDEYGFYSNVNPEVDHPRWSQATERRIGEFTRRPTLPFNGYEKDVAHLYTGMDLRKHFLMGTESAPHPWLKPGVYAGCLTPLGILIWRGSHGQLGADIVASVLNQLGYLALTLLIASLSCTPIKIVTGWTWSLRLRRMLGLFAFFYAALHFLTYFVVDQNLDLQVVLADIAKRKFILVGFCALIVLLLLTRTSTQQAVRRMGFVRWKRLHRLAYVAGGLAAVHFIWRVKADLREPLIFLTLLAAGLLLRVLDALRSRARKLRPASVT